MKTKIKRESISVYFLAGCDGGPQSKDFWPTFKPFLPQKSTTKDDPNIRLKEDEKLVSDQNIVSEKMNDFYVNIAQHIDINSTLKVNDEHPSTADGQRPWTLRWTNVYNRMLVKALVLIGLSNK